MMHMQLHFRKGLLILQKHIDGDKQQIFIFNRKGMDFPFELDPQRMDHLPHQRFWKPMERKEEQTRPVESKYLTKKI